MGIYHGLSRKRPLLKFRLLLAVPKLSEIFSGLPDFVSSMAKLSPFRLIFALLSLACYAMLLVLKAVRSGARIGTLNKSFLGTHSAGPGMLTGVLNLASITGNPSFLFEIWSLAAY